MPRVINLKALIVDTVTVNVEMPDGQIKVYNLKDDTSLDIALRTIDVMQQAQDLAKLNADSTGNRAEMVKALQTLDTEVTHVLGEIFRHTYPGTTDEELTALLDFQERMQLVTHFFTSSMRRFSVRPSAMDSSMSTASPAETTPEVVVESSSDTSQDETPSPNDSTATEEDAPVA